MPSHLPRTGEQPTFTPPEESMASEIKVDTVLELFEPLFWGGDLDSQTVRGVRESIQATISKNKVGSLYQDVRLKLIRQATSHAILKANYPSIASQIRNGSQITSDFKSIQSNLSELEKKLDPSNSEVS